MLLEALQLGHRGQERPGFAGDQPHMTVAARHASLEADPALGYAAGLGALALELPGRRLSWEHRALDHLAHLGVALGGGDVPGERHQVAPVAVVAEQGRGGRGVAAVECPTKCGQPVRYLWGRRPVAHRLPPGLGWVARDSRAEERLAVARGLALDSRL